jgi:hypothetical protein
MMIKPGLVHPPAYNPGSGSFTQTTRWYPSVRVILVYNACCFTQTTRWYPSVRVIILVYNASCFTQTTRWYPSVRVILVYNASFTLPDGIQSIRPTTLEDIPTSSKGQENRAPESSELLLWCTVCALCPCCFNYKGKTFLSQ